MPNLWDVLWDVITWGIPIVIVATTLWLNWNRMFPRKIVKVVVNTDTTELKPAVVKAPVQPVQVVKTTPTRSRSRLGSYVLKTLWILFLVFGAWVLLLTFIYWVERLKQPAEPKPAQMVYLTRTELRPMAVKFWYDHLPPEKAWEMVLTTKGESEFEHWDENRNILKNPVSSARGLMQIKELWRPRAESLGFDLDTPMGQLNMALHIYQTKGPAEWQAYKDLAKTPPRVTRTLAPVGKWSPKQEILRGAICVWLPDRLIQGMDDKGNLLEFIPGESAYFNSTDMTYTVPDEPAGIMEVKCQP